MNQAKQQACFPLRSFSISAVLQLLHARTRTHTHTHRGTHAHTHTCQLALQEVAEAQEVVVQNEQEDNDGRHEDGDVH